ncbi:Lrp/AsnC family transcriptional regulator [Pararhizobium mangrovi]|uniref:Lrp/AsnC family transcriptional regulator n=1 Tax=Pararhizobium mangrovi TaxID=2590452 RepID=A0A506UHM4_9HYPH|nr:Lrp/AsnC family transcriptional regulator [Pararhizobium mangrovi]TPW32817.1 Lrp/AsnC family transcriptional regulator [Pararhizobium mangrovi]
MTAKGRFRLDERDLEILSILQKEGRITSAALAARVNLSPTPTWERVKRLEKAGIIQGYGARVAPDLFGPSTVVFVEAQLDSHRSDDVERFEDVIRNTPEIVECWGVGGGMDYLLKVVARDIDAYQRLVDRLLVADIGLRRYYTHVVTKPVKTGTNIRQLPEADPE